MSGSKTPLAVSRAAFVQLWKAGLRPEAEEACRCRIVSRDARHAAAGCSAAAVRAAAAACCITTTYPNPLLQGRVGALRVRTRRFQRAHAVGHVGGCARRAVLQRTAA